MSLSNERPVGKRFPVVHPSAVDLWVAALLMLTPLSAAFLGVYLLVVGDPGGASILFLTGAAAVLLIAAFTAPCRYTILEDALSIRCGLAFRQIAFEQIDGAEPTWSLQGGWGLSARRVAIRYRKRILLISPKDRDAFLKDLREAMAGRDAEATSGVTPTPVPADARP